MADYGIIYKWTNTLNNKSYIGQTIHPERRYKRHLNDAFKEKVDTHFYRALRKYGTANFTYEVLETVETCKLNEKEIYWIDYFDSYYNGYNETKGGSGTSGFKWSKEAKQKHSERMTIINRQNFAGRVSPNKGKHFRPKSNEEKAKVSKKVFQYTLTGEFIKEWPSTAECARNGYNQGHIASCCRGDKRQYKGYIWVYTKIE